MALFDTISYGREWLAPYACLAGESRGRLVKEGESPTRTPFQRDRDRIIHSTAFRRLKHKTQVFVFHVGDHYRTRLTHSIEVSQIARSLARALRLDEDLAESLALCHDFGHTPFGHVGEDILADIMKDDGGFDHNAQSLKIVTELEQQYADFDGLNLSWETLEGLVKHNGPLVGDDVPRSILRFNERFDLSLSSHASAEAQCAAVADDIAYNAHDIDDGLRAGLFTLDDLREVPIAGETLALLDHKYPGLEPRRQRHEIIRKQITAMVEDVILNANRNLGEIDPGSADDIRNCGETVVCFSPLMAAMERQIKDFLYARMYRSPSVMVMREGAETIIRDLFGIYQNETGSRPKSLRERITVKPEGSKLRVITDFIASMTDDYAIKQHQRLFDHTPELG
ncbi:MAG: deoxyguanosinetriphosphate triphosphohydrolase [Pseudomonadota bacterium]